MGDHISYVRRARWDIEERANEEVVHLAREAIMPMNEKFMIAMQLELLYSGIYKSN